jgi:hypothetical protein
MRFDIRAPVVPSVVGLLAQGGIRANQLTWESFGYTVAVYGSTTNNRGNATRLGITSDNVFTHMLNGSVDYYYWVRGVDAQGRETGVWNPTNSVAGLQVTSQLMVELDIAANAVSAAKLNVAAISSATGNLNPGTVNSANIVAGAISSREISAGYIYAGTVAASNISSGTLSSQVVYAGTISANNITSGTLSAMSISGGDINIGSGAFSVNTGGTTFISQFSSSSITSLFLKINSASGPGINCIADSGHSIEGQASAVLAHGIVGYSGGGGYDFYAFGAAANYGAFTGAHDAVVENNFAGVVGDIVIDTGVASRTNVSNTICFVDQSSALLQKAAVGVVVSLPKTLDPAYPPAAMSQDSSDPEADKVPNSTFYSLIDTHKLIVMNAVGEGQVNVCGESGDLEIGDLIVTSSMPGKGMKQADDLVRSYTVAKCRENVTFDSPEQVKMVACIYLCG